MTPQTHPPEVTRATTSTDAAREAGSGADAATSTDALGTGHPEGQARTATITWASLFVVILVLVVAAGAALAGPWTVTPDPAPFATAQATPEATEPAPTPTAPPEEAAPPNPIVERTLTTVLLVAGGLVTAFLLYRLTLWVRRTVLPWLAAHKDRPQPPAPGLALTYDALPLTELRDAATHAEMLLHQGEGSPDAIIAAWLALQDAAERSGATRGPAQTPTEFTVEVLAATPASPQAVTELLGLFHLARFARTDMTPAQVAAAGTALRQLIDDFSRTTHPTDAEPPTDPTP